MERHTLAYLIIAVFAVAAIVWGAFRWYHGRDRAYQRRQALEHAAHLERMAEKAPEESP